MFGKKHPRALPYLFFTEMWERFGFYLMIGIFVLYLMDVETGGFGMSRASASDIYGTFIAFVYLTPFIGGFLADRKIGYINAIFIGGAMMGLGYMTLALPHLWAFYLGLGLIILGNGFFKPNISTLLGNLYNQPEYKPYKDEGYNIFYMGINIGAFVCNFFAAYFRNTIGWGAAFFAAGVGMFIGLIVFRAGLKHVRHADIQKADRDPQADSALRTVLTAVIGPAVLAGIAGWFFPGNIFGSDSTDAFIAASIPVVIYYARLWWTANAQEKKPIGALLAIFAVAVMFWAVFKQNGTALTTWAEYYTDRTIPESMAASLETFGFAETVVYEKSDGPLYNDGFQKIRDENGVIQRTNDYPIYFKNVVDKPPESAKWNLLNTEIFQSINPFFVVIITPLLVWFFSFLRRRGKEPRTPAKIAWGLFISACSTLVMVWAVYATHNGIEKASGWWLVGTYGVITIGELFLSPMGLSLVSKLSPVRLTGMMMGGWFLSTAIGNKLSGVLATLWDGYAHKANFFWVNFVLLMIAVGIMLFMLKRLNKVFAEYAEE